jgi:uncharacterized OsmC-like protein
MKHRILVFLSVALTLAILFGLQAPAVQAIPTLQDATPTPAPEEEAAPATDEEAAPQLATASAVVDLSNQFGRTLVTARKNTFIVDSAPPLGHPSEEMNPVEAMLAALGTCGIVVYETAAQELDIPLTAATVTIQGDFDVRGLTGAADVDPRVQEYRAHVDLEGPDAAQADALFEQWSLRCPIYTTLIKTAPIVVTNNDEEMGGPSAEGLATATIAVSLSNQPGRTIVNVRDNYLIVDSVPPLGGPNLEVNPMDLFLSALGSCGAVIIEKAAIDYDIPLDGVTGTVEADFDPRGLTDGTINPAVQAMRVNWEIGTESDEDAEFLIDQWLTRCPIYNTMIRATDIEVSHRLKGEGTALLDITFSYNIPSDEFQAEISPLAEQFAAADGLIWKIWALDEANSQFSSMLLFEDDAAMQAFLEGELAAAVMAHPALSDFEVTPFSIMGAETMITGGPIR